MKSKLVKAFQRLIEVFSFMEKYRDVKVNTVEDIYKIPFTRRLELQDWVLENAPERPVIFYEATGGMGGKNFFIGINEKSHDFMVRRAVKAIGLMGVKKGSNCLNLLFSDLVERGIIEYGGVLMSVGDVYNYKTYKLAQDAIKSLNIKYVFACPNLIYDVLLPLGKNHSIEKCMVSGELLMPSFRISFLNSTGIPLYNWYGSSGGFIAAQDNPKDEYMKIIDDGLYLEVIDKHGKSKETGEGFLVYTDLFNYSTPIIRYLLEDRVRIIRRGKNRYVKIYQREGKHIKLDGELVYKEFIIEEMRKILHHNHFIAIIKKTEDYKDKIIISTIKDSLNDDEKIEKIKDFFSRCIGLIPAIVFLDKLEISKLIREKGYIVDLRRVK